MLYKCLTLGVARAGWFRTHFCIVSHGPKTVGAARLNMTKQLLFTVECQIVFVLRHLLLCRPQYTLLTPLALSLSIWSSYGCFFQGQFTSLDNPLIFQMTLPSIGRHQVIMSWLEIITVYELILIHSTTTYRDIYIQVLCMRAKRTWFTTMDFHKCSSDLVNLNSQNLLVRIVENLWNRQSWRHHVGKSTL